MSRAHLLCTLAGALAGAGCASGADMAKAFDSAADSAARVRTLRVDVHPGGSSGLEPQTWEAEPGQTRGLEVELAATVVYGGRVTGFRVNPYADIGVPGEQDVPVIARIEATATQGISGARVLSGADGTFSLPLPADLEYLVAVIPEDPVRLPPLILAASNLAETWTADLQLGFGVPVYGRILQADDAPAPGGLSVAVLDPGTGIMGSPVAVDADGYYQVRATPGEIVLVFDDEDGTGPNPRVEVEVTVEEDTPLRRDVTIGTIRSARVHGQVYDEDGRTLADAELRFRPVALDGIPYPVDFSRTTETDGSGVFNRDLAYGTWEVEVIPPFESQGNASPSRFSLEVASTDVAVDDINLVPPVSVDATVYGVGGDPLPGVIVTFTEQGYAGWSWTATSDSAGRINLMVPNGPMNLTLTPPDTGAAITTYSVESPSALPRLELKRGQLVDGAVVSGGEPVPYALVELRDSQGALLGATLTDGGGGFAVQVRAAD